MVGGGDLVNRGVDGLVNRGVGGLALILDVHHVARVAVGGVVADDLGAAVGKEDAVRAVGGVAVTGLIGAKLHIGAIAVLGIDTVLVLVLGGCLLVSGLVVGSGVGGHSDGHGEEGEEGDEGLQGVMMFMRLPFLNVLVLV